jgi:altronate hydrolase
MYGVIVGRAKKEIAIGEVINTKNIIHETEKYSVPKTNQKINWVGPKIDAYTKKTFLGYHRENGSVGTENNWLVIPLVFCQNRNIETLKNTILKVWVMRIQVNNHMI